MVEKNTSESRHEVRRLNCLIQEGIKAGERYFPQGAEEFDDQKVELRMNKGDLQIVQTLSRTFVNSAYGKHSEKALFTNPVILKNSWDNFAENQLLVCMELEKVVSAALFKTNPPAKPEDWINLNKAETKINVSFKTARSITQVLTGAMDLEDLESTDLDLDKDRKKYYDHVIIKDKKMKCIKSLLSQLAEQKLPVNQDEITSLQIRLTINEPDAEMAKILLEQGLV